MDNKALKFLEKFLVIFGGVATIFSCGVVVLAFLVPKQTTEIVVQLFSITQEAVVITVEQIPSLLPVAIVETSTVTPIPMAVTATSLPSPVTESTQLLLPVATPTPTIFIVPTATLTPTVFILPTATPDIRLFSDDFELGISPEWNIQGSNFNSVNGKLISAGTLQASVGNNSWSNYRIILINWYKHYGADLAIQIRKQDENNFLEFRCNGKGYVDRDDPLVCSWQKISNGTRLIIPGTYFSLPKKPIIEVEAFEYRIIDLESGNTLIRFIDNTVSYGGIVIVADGQFELDAIEVYPLP